MAQSNTEIEDARARTDASLEAERAAPGVANDEATLDARRLQDDLVERDRRQADVRLLKFRDGADRILSRERSDAPSPDSTVSQERDAADRRRRLERAETDAIRQEERQGSDIAIEADRSEHDALHTELETRRQNTDDQLLMERRGADTTASSLGQTKGALARARTKEGLRRDMLGTVAHELRNPLTVISLTTAHVAQTSHDASVLADAHAIELAVARMDRLLSDLIDVARIDAGMLHIIKRRHDVGALLLEIRASYGPLFSTRHVAFTVHTPKDGIEACFDHDRIVQVLSNLLGNAMKFTPRGGAVALDVERQPEGVVFTVSDNGPGIPPLALSHVFERFWQIDSEARRGLGLGLHICENIVHAHGGQIGVESEPGKGAKFRFTVPDVAPGSSVH